MTQFNEHEWPRQLNGALPGWAVDAILFGLPGRDRRDSRRVCGKCVSIAMSAYRRGLDATVRRWTDHRHL